MSETNTTLAGRQHPNTPQMDGNAKTEKDQNPPSAFVTNFDEYFQIKLATTEDLRQDCYKIRHEVYVEEFGWEPVSKNKMEIDECDFYSISILLQHKRTGANAGTVRLVIPPSDRLESQLPFEIHCDDTVRRDVIDPKALRRGSYGEMSRMCVPPDFRRRTGEKNTPFIVNDLKGDNIFSDEETRNFPKISVGLYFGVLALAKMRNLSHFFVVMEPRLSRRIRRLGIHLKQCGDELDYHGIRALYYLESKDYVANLKPEMQELFELLEHQLETQNSALPH